MWTKLPRRSSKLARYPKAPEGRGPILEWYQATIDSAILSGLAVSAIMFVLMCLRDWGFDWMSTWWLWIFVVAPVILWPLWILAFHSSGISAGADWLAVKKGYIDTYELTEARVEGASGGLAWTLELTDKKGVELSIDAADIEANQALWDLVYNGIRYSVQRGSAKTNPRALDKLRLR
ncbi:hypothetical protein SAMN05216215_1004185 [Saccharopolyspora shandongensis]|uniref:Uncharacterized protein n=1 Tax=Saccharopolyspora shandongensis TaxID=418495 RepID=A0A1H2V4H8_9PSEU|nr:hypothetical protein [Saccharopolyspora shandongensis]SDW62864.1 hypothetical protein SAMN05216215_1004185 [Saccharopolyspora shandongensis]